MKKTFAALFLLASVCHPSFAGEAANQANSFARIYRSLCLNHLSNLDEVRDKLKDATKLAPEQAAQFLSGRPGDAWPVPDSYGSFVLAIPHGVNLCSVYGRRVDTETTEKLFAELVNKAPAPLSSKLVMDKNTPTSANGATHTISYEWVAPHQRKKKMLFTLTTAKSDTAQLQALGTAAIVED